MKKLLSGEEKLTTSENAIGSNIRNITVKYAPPAPSPYSNYYVLGPNRYIQFRRKISREDVKKINQDLTPGFQIKWFYTNGSGIVEVNLDSKWFYNDEITKLRNNERTEPRTSVKNFPLKKVSDKCSNFVENLKIR